MYGGAFLILKARMAIYEVQNGIHIPGPRIDRMIQATCRLSQVPKGFDIQLGNHRMPSSIREDTTI